MSGLAAFHGDARWGAMPQGVFNRSARRRQGGGNRFSSLLDRSRAELIRIEVTRRGHFNPVFKEAPHARQRVF